MLDISLLGKAEAAGLLDVRVHDLRDWASDKHRTVDDTPYGGGAGMVMRPDVWGKALDQIIGDEDVVLALPTPSGETFTQRKAEELTRAKRIVFAPGRYEGIDARLAQHYRSKKNVTVMEFSIGDYVLNGGEIASLVVIESVGRLLDGVVGNPLLASRRIPFHCGPAGIPRFYEAFAVARAQCSVRAIGWQSCGYREVATRPGIAADL